jgi:AcrR family transcriptional regulator
MSDNALEIDREVLAAWGRDARARRGSRPGLTLERITRVAAAIADRDGLGAISMARVAAELGFTTMSLYRHVASKDQLLTLMVDAASGPAPKSRHADGDWRAGLAVWTRSLMEVYAAHPWIVDVTIAGAPLLPNQADWMDWALAIMRETVLTPGERIATLLLLSGYVRNETRLARDLARGQAASGRTELATEEQYWRLLASLITPEQMPALHELATISAGPASAPADVEDGVDPFTFGLERILDGLQAYMDAVARGPSRRPPRNRRRPPRPRPGRPRDRAPRIRTGRR